MSSASWPGYCPVRVLYLLCLFLAVPLGWLALQPLCADFLAVLIRVLSEGNGNGAHAPDADVACGDSFLIVILCLIVI